MLRDAWCVMNSTALKSILGLVLLGAIGRIVPVLVRLPEAPTVSSRRSTVPYDEFRRSRLLTKVWGGCAVFLSLLTLVPFLLLWARLKGKSCDVEIAGSNRLLVIALMILALLCVLSFVAFFFASQRMLKQHESLA